MELKIGDKVRYLDAVGGGTVHAFKGKDQVIVLEEDGFETPVLKRQCVVIEDKKDTRSAPTGYQSNKTVNSPTVESVTVRAEPKTTASKSTYRQPQSREGERLNIHLAFLPAEGHSFQEAIFEAYLINESNFNLMYTLSNADGASWLSRSTGLIEANSKLFVEEFGREVITELERLSVQLLAFKPDRAYSFKNPISVELRLDTVKFYKIHCFKTNDFFEEEAWVVPVVVNDVPERSLLSDPEVLRIAMLEKKADRPRISEPLAVKTNQPLEIDLHVGNLLDTTAGMDAAAILQHQMDVIRKTLDENKGKKGFKIVFIHGKGEGVLRAALLKELSQNYKTCRYQDASFREYGFGATLVSIG